MRMTSNVMFNYLCCFVMVIELAHSDVMVWFVCSRGVCKRWYMTCASQLIQFV